MLQMQSHSCDVRRLEKYSKAGYLSSAAPGKDRGPLTWDEGLADCCNWPAICQWACVVSVHGESYVGFETMRMAGGTYSKPLLLLGLLLLFLLQLLLLQLLQLQL